MLREKKFEVFNNEKGEGEIKKMSEMSNDFRESRENISVSELSEDDRAQVKELEEAVSVLFDDKSEVASKFQIIKRYFPDDIFSTSSGKNKASGGAMEEVFVNKEKYLQIATNKLEDDLRRDGNGERFIEDAIEDLEHEFNDFLHKYESHKESDDYYGRIRQYKEAESEEEKVEIYKGLPVSVKMLASYKNFVLQEFVEARREMDELSLYIEELKKSIDNLRSEGGGDVDVRVGKKQSRLINAIKERQEITHSSPEAYLYDAINRLQEAKNVIDSNGSIIETPYVKGKLEQINDHSAIGRPVFIHGELGGGKSELAKHDCRTRLSGKFIQRWEAKNPKPTDAEEIKLWEKKRKDAIEPYIITGNKNLDINDLFGRMSAKAAETMSPEEQALELSRRTKAFEANGERSSEEIADFKKLCIESFNNPIEVVPIVGLFYKAMQEGRPIILDELNAIPHTALIALNDLLTLRPGARVNSTIPGIDSFTVEEGFCVIATGNWKPEDGKAYFGRQGLDAAFLSRFGIVSYDYLPQSLVGASESTDEASERKEKAESELYDIMIASLLDESLGFRAPAETIDKLRSLARIARRIQNIFSDKEEGEEQLEILSMNKKMKYRSGLHENVLSIRHLIPIIKKWKSNGFNFSLEDYILSDYIDRSSHAHPVEKIAIYRQMQLEGGLFKTSEGWPDSLTIEGEKEILALDPNDKLRKYEKISGMKTAESIKDDNIKIVYTPMKEVIKELFGSIPERKTVRKTILQKEHGEVQKENIDIESARELERVLGRLNNLNGDIVNDAELDEKDKKSFESFNI